MDRKGRSMKKFKFFILCIVLVVLSVFSFLGFNNVNVSANEENDVVLNIYKNNISYSSEIFILYAVEYENIDLDNNEISMLFFEHADSEFIKGNEAYASYSKGIEEVEGKDCLIFYSEGLAAKEMTDYVYSRVYVNIDGVDYYSEINRYSVLEYVYEIKEYKELSEEEIEFFDNMLAYGASAQKIFDYKEDRLANSTYYKINVVDAVLDGNFSSALYQLNEIVTISAYEEKDGIPFAYWKDKEGNVVSGDRVFEIKVEESNNYIAFYGDGLSFEVLDDIRYEEQLAYDYTVSYIAFPSEAEFEYNGLKLSVPVEFDKSTFVPHEIGTQRINAIITDYTVLNNYQIVIENIYMDVEVLPYTLSLSNGEYAIKKYYGTETEIVIPSEYRQYKITKIDDYAFEDCTGLTKVTISEGITSIGHSAFWSCNSMESIVFPSTLTSIGGSAFSWCSSLKNVFYNGTMEDWCNLTLGNDIYWSEGHFFMLGDNEEYYEVSDFVIPSTITSISQYAFKENFSIVNLTIPSTIKTIGMEAFSWCSNLENVYYDGTIEDWCSIEFKSIESNPMFHAKHFFMLDENEEYYEVEELVIPANSSKIGMAQFCGFENISSVIIPEGVTSIENYAFYQFESLVSIELPDSLEKIGKGAFSGCIRLQSIEIPTKVTNIDLCTFEGCKSLINVMIPEGVTNIGSLSFYGCDSLVNIELPSSMSTIGDTAFKKCTKLESIIIPENVKKLNSYTFEYCTSLKSVVLPSKLESLGYGVFSNCSSLESIIIPASVTEVNSDVFFNCNVLEIKCEVSEQPISWDNNWNPRNCPVTWGYTEND